jgi:mRNA export factor
MSGLFGNVGTTAATTAATNTTGDISKDVALNSPPEDSISDLAFSPVSNHLAVASWDKKVRIYEINDQGQSEGKALFEHEAPVLNCCWSPVSILLREMLLSENEANVCRMEQKSSVSEQTKLRVYWT